MTGAERKHHEDNVERLTSKVAQLQKDLHEAKVQLRSHRTALAPFKVGDIVLAKTYGANRAHRPVLLQSVEHAFGGSYYYKGSTQNKGGEFSKMVQHVQDPREMSHAG